MKFQYRYFSLLILALAVLFVSQFFGLFVLAETTSALRPIADGGDDSADWDNSGGTACNAADCYLEVDEGSGGECTNSDGDTSYIETGTNGATQTFNLDLSGVTNDSTITQIDITVCASRQEGGAKIQTRYCIDSLCSNSGTDINLGSSYGETTQSFTGFSLTKDASTDLEIGALNNAAKISRVSQISAVITYTTVPPPDTTAPAAVTDLAASDVTTSSIALSWTAPGDDENSGTATAYDVRYSTSNINNESKWNSATQVSGEPTPSIAGSSESMTVSELSAGTEYFFAIKTSDEVPNESDLSNVVSETTAAPSDTTAPAAITDLTASSPSASSIDLSWTAPGDDNNTGTATTYDIRYRTNAINSGNWNSATQATGEPSPSIAGSNETMTVSGLSADTTYYFAIKASDEVPNESDLSNVVSETTTADAGGDANWNQQKFWFRDDDGDEVDATGFGAEDVSQNTNIINVAPGTDFRVRFAIKITGADGSIAPQLEFKEGTECTSGNWTVVTLTTDIFNLNSSSYFDDGASTTQQITTGPNFTAGQILESTNPAPTLNMLKNQSTEYEWSLGIAPDVPFATTYSFRVTNNGTALDNYDQCPALTIQAPPLPPSPPSSDLVAVGGITRPTTVIFSGRAFPGAKILMVDKDIISEKIVSQNPIVSEEGKFSASFIGIMQSRHSFGLLVKDKENRATPTKFFNIDALASDLIVEDILVPPTVGFTQGIVTRGRNVVIIGYASPENNVKIEIGDIKKEIKAEKDGSYKIEVNTGMFDFGQYRVRAKQADPQEKRESDFGITKTLVVSRLTSPKTDLSGDGRVDIKDWSIFLSNWGLREKIQPKIIDFNSDGKIDISDFSIFIRTIKK